MPLPRYLDNREDKIKLKQLTQALLQLYQALEMIPDANAISDDEAAALIADHMFILNATNNFIANIIEHLQDNPINNKEEFSRGLSNLISHYENHIKDRLSPYLSFFEKILQLIKNLISDEYFTAINNGKVTLGAKSDSLFFKSVREIHKENLSKTVIDVEQKALAFK